METQNKEWEEKTEEERAEWAEEMLERWADLRDEVREATSSDGPEAEWAQYEQQDLYRETVLSTLGEDEADFVQDTDETEEDFSETFYRCCSAAFRSGRTPAACADDWRCRGIQ